MNAQHPNVHQAFAQWSEDQKLYVVSMYSNPSRWNARRQLFNDFRLRLAGNPTVVLYVVEVAFGDRPFEVTEPNNPQHIQLRSSDELWLKENALNIGISRLPADARYIAYLDGDVQMSRYDWALETIHLLQHYDAVQLFSTFSDMDASHRPISVTPGFAYRYAQHILPPEYYPNQFSVAAPATKKPAPIDTHGVKGAKVIIASAHTSPISAKEKSTPVAKAELWGASGLGWAYRRSALNSISGLLDTCILGSADWHMGYGMAGLANTYMHPDFVSDPYVRAIQAWQTHAASLKANIWYLDNHITHYWHGPKSNRFYRERSQILSSNQFDPTTDLKRDTQGLLTLAGNKPKLRDDLRAYFRARNEDDLRGGGAPLA